jgi:hypothetical protein
VAELLEAVKPEVERQRLFRNVVFRYLLSSARVAKLRHEPAAPQLARAALAVAAERTPSFPRHQDIGRPTASTDEVAELEQIVQAADPPHIGMGRRASRPARRRLQADRTAKPASERNLETG